MTNLNINLTYAVALLIILREVESLHQRIYLAAVLFGRAACASLAEDKDGLARNIEFVQLLLRCDVEAIHRHILGPLAAADQIQDLVLVCDGHLLDRYDIALLDLA